MLHAGRLFLDTSFTTFDQSLVRSNAVSWTSSFRIVWENGNPVIERLFPVVFLSSACLIVQITVMQLNNGTAGAWFPENNATQGNTGVSTHQFEPYVRE